MVQNNRILCKKKYHIHAHQKRNRKHQVVGYLCSASRSRYCENKPREKAGCGKDSLVGFHASCRRQTRFKWAVMETKAARSQEKSEKENSVLAGAFLSAAARFWFVLFWWSGEICYFALFSL